MQQVKNPKPIKSLGADQLLGAGVHPWHADSGHTVKGSAGTITYEHISAATLRRAVESIQYPGLDLPRVYACPAPALTTRTGR